jgi:tetratricopeptide (TPR) repeat protein
MLLALAGQMPEALLALSNAIDLAKTKPTDDPLALARAHEAIGRTLLEMRENKRAIASLNKAVEEFSNQGKAETKEVAAIKLVIQSAT